MLIRNLVFLLIYLENFTTAQQTLKRENVNHNTTNFWALTLLIDFKEVDWEYSVKPILTS